MWNVFKALRFLGRGKRAQNQDLQQRLAKCEALLSKLARSAVEHDAPEKAQTEYDINKSIGRLVLDDDGACKIHR